MQDERMILNATNDAVDPTDYLGAARWLVITGVYTNHQPEREHCPAGEESTSERCTVYIPCPVGVVLAG